MRRLLEDSWIQMFAFLAALSAAFMAPGLIRSTQLPALQNAAAPAAPPAASAPARALKPKASGKWVVDQAMALDADTSKIAEALENAAEGDSIYIRAGTYSESLAVARSASLIGLGNHREDVTVTSAKQATVSVSSGKVLIKNLTVLHAGPEASKALEVKRASLELVGAKIKAGPDSVGADVSGGSLSAGYTAFESGYKAVDAHDEATVKLEESSVAGAETGVAVAGRGSSAQLSNTKFSGNKVGLWAERSGAAKVKGGKFLSNANAISAADQGKVEVEGASFYDNAASALYAESGAEVSDKGSTIQKNRSVAILVTDKASLKLFGTQVEDGSGDALGVNDGASATLSDVEIVRNAEAGLSIRQAGSVRLARSRIIGQKKCGIELATATLNLDNVQVNRNQCGIAFYGPGTLEAGNSDLTGNKDGPILYSEQYKGGIILRGRNNKPALEGLLQ